MRTSVLLPRLGMGLAGLLAACSANPPTWDEPQLHAAVKAHVKETSGCNSDVIFRRLIIEDVGTFVPERNMHSVLYTAVYACSYAPDHLRDERNVRLYAKMRGPAIELSMPFEINGGAAEVAAAPQPVQPQPSPAPAPVADAPEPEPEKTPAELGLRTGSRQK